MFETHELGRVPLHPEMFSRHEHAWNFVKLGNNDPWLVVRVVVSNVAETMFLQQKIERQIPELLSMSDRCIECMQLMRTRSDAAWVINDVTRIRVGHYVANKCGKDVWQPVREYLFSDGARFAHTEFETIEDELPDMKVLYSAFPRAASG